MKRNDLFLIILILLSGCSITPPVGTVTISPTRHFSITAIPTERVIGSPPPVSTETLVPSFTPMKITGTPILPPTKAAYSYRPEIADGSYLLISTSSESLELRAFNDAFDGTLLTVAHVDSLEPGKSLSPDGKLLAYSLRDSSGWSHLMILDLIDNSLKEVESGSECFSYSFAPDSRHLAAICNQHRPPEVFVIDLLNGVRSQPLIKTDYDQITSVAWSPDGKLLAYVVSTTPFPTRLDYDNPLYLMDTSCLNSPQTCQNRVRLLTKSAHYFYDSPIKWSSDSQNILIQDGEAELKIINILDSSWRNIAQIEGQSPEFIAGFGWSPDNRYVALRGRWPNTQQSQDILPIIAVNASDGGSKPFKRVIEGRGDILNVFDWIKLLDFKIGSTYSVTSSAKDLALREKPFLISKQIKNLQTNDTVLIVDGPVNADYCIWWKMRVGNVEGWAPGIKYWFDAVK